MNLTKTPVEVFLHGGDDPSISRVDVATLISEIAAAVGALGSNSDAAFATLLLNGRAPLMHFAELDGADVPTKSGVYSYAPTWADAPSAVGGQLTYMDHNNDGSEYSQIAVAADGNTYTRAKDSSANPAGPWQKIVTETDLSSLVFGVNAVRTDVQGLRPANTAFHNNTAKMRHILFEAATNTTFSTSSDGVTWVDHPLVNSYEPGAFWVLPDEHYKINKASYKFWEIS